MVDLVELISDYQIKDVIRSNRTSLEKVEQWISEEAYRSSVCRYGISDGLKEYVNLPIGEFPTYTDVILLLSRRLKKSVSYLEIGVSVGKNFLQVADFLENSLIFGFDIEKINPVLESLLIRRQVLSQWEADDPARKSHASSLTEFFYPPRNNRVFYLCGDLRDEEAWKRLNGLRFNLIFSDAVHSPDWVLHEYRMIERHGLRDKEEFVYVWDDLAGPMVFAFDAIWYELEKEGAQRYIIPLNGWLGVNEPPHMVGFILKVAQ